MSRGPKPEDSGAPVADESQDQYIIFTQRIDPYSYKRSRVRITPAVCDVCGVDLVEKNAERLSAALYEDLDATEQTALQKLLREHKRSKHSTAERLVVNKSDMNREWLRN